MNAGDKATLHGTIGDKVGDLVYFRPDGGGSAILINPSLLEEDGRVGKQPASSEVPPYAKR
jgi:hypothetical protein